MLFGAVAFRENLLFEIIQQRERESSETIQKQSRSVLKPHRNHAIDHFWTACLFEFHSFLVVRRW